MADVNKFDQREIENRGVEIRKQKLGNRNW